MKIKGVKRLWRRKPRVGKVVNKVSERKQILAKSKIKRITGLEKENKRSKNIRQKKKPRLENVGSKVSERIRERLGKY